MAGPGSGGDRGARRRRVRARVLLAAAALLVLIGGAVGWLALTRPPATGPAAPVTASAGPTVRPSPTAAPSLADLGPGPMNVLLLGSDIRGSARDALARQAAAGGAADQRADMMMLLHVQADHRRVFGISIMRDTWVTVPGHGESKVNASLALGGPQLAAATVSSILSVRIDHWALLDFDGFKAITDALGGVDVDVPVAFTATFDTHHAFTRGINHLNGQAALEFVRERHAFADGDYQRVRDQQAFVRSVIAQLLAQGRVGNPAGALALIGLVGPHLVTDPGLGAEGLTVLAYGLRHADPSSDVFFTLPTSGTGTSADGQSIVIADRPGIAAVAAALGSDSLGQYAALHGLS
ncbi:LCP family protein required for cell wall assembly [Sinomonas atrocyanea]|uniref:LCP family protein n=1 Tax=Sinomonas atrocyanea TaxID=37927 RepID=UPI002784157B|nr:LCP family protein [Sinomonas atrocyanea]MDP9884025.1 LCP family protein required for cell wall assembly [Sinomonas atrocyanea]